MVKLQIERVLREKKITKTAFAEMLGIKKQNVNILLDTRNIDKIQEIADALQVDVQELLFETSPKISPIINGYVEINEEIHPVKNTEQLLNLIDKVDGVVHIPSCFRGENLKHEIETFCNASMLSGSCGAIMKRYRTNEVFNLSFDPDSRRFILTTCTGDGITEFITFDLAKYNRLLVQGTQDKNHLVDDIMDFIESVYE